MLEIFQENMPAYGDETRKQVFLSRVFYQDF